MPTFSDVGTLTYHDGDDNENVKKAIGWISMWLLASPGPRGRVIFAPFWGQVTAVIFKLMIVSSAVGDLFAR